MNSKILLAVSVVFAASGQVLFKKGMLMLGQQTLSSDVLGMIRMTLRIVFSPVVFIGLVLYVLSTILWLVALSRIPLNFAYPFTAGTFVLVMAASYFIFSEGISLNRIIGGAVICAGIIISAIK